MNEYDDSFKEYVDELLQASGRHFQGIHLRCRICGEQGYANSVEIAETLGGWSELSHVKGPRHVGLCVDCTTTKERKTP